MGESAFKRSLPDWSSGLPTEILEDIAKKLPSGQDAASFRSVCSPWRSAMPFASFAPVLMLPFDPHSPEGTNIKATFYSLEKEKTFVLPLPELHGKVVLGSSCGWLALMDEAASVTLLNPFTGSRVALPPADERVAEASSKSVVRAGGDGGRWALRYFSGDVSPPITLDKMRDVFFLEIVLSKAPSNFCGGGSDDGCVAMAVLADSSEVAFCRVGDKAWTLIETNVECCISSVVHCQDRFLAVGCVGEISIISSNITGDDATPPPARPVSSLPEPADMCQRSYLQVNGQLHLVGVAMEIFHSQWPSGHPHTVVFKCDLTGETPVWSRVTEANDTAMFVSKYFNTVFSGASVSKIKRNCIYFSEPMNSHQGDGGDHSPKLVDIATGTAKWVAYTPMHGFKALCWIRAYPSMKDSKALCWIRPNLWT